MSIPVIDIFAGPGGLGEGFSALLDAENQRVFEIALSIEKDYYAHQTLTLRSFFRQFPPNQVPDDYYEFIKGNITREELFNQWPKQAKKARKEAWHAELGDGKEAASFAKVDKKIRKALKGRRNWLLIGGPPCQAYSIVGRSRRKEKILDEKKDERVGLYKQYLRILAVHNPPVFVMENVKGLLSARTKSNPVFSKILSDLANPVGVFLSNNGHHYEELSDCPGYKVYSLVSTPANAFYQEENPEFKHKDFLIALEKYGIPQTRHRVILLGIRKDIDCVPDILSPKEEIPVSEILNGLPRLRSGLSRIEDTPKNWKIVLNQIRELSDLDPEIKKEIEEQLKKIAIPRNGVGHEYVPIKSIRIGYRPDWYLDPKIDGICNHVARPHMESDILRYFFLACFAKTKKRSPKLRDFPKSLLPAHKNVKAGVKERKFADRFRVHVWEEPAKTITSHIHKDGHYYIHPDPTQCRSFTVREAARIQTFPDNYFFCGPRTAQYIQVGNAVPPLLANQIAVIVMNLIKAQSENKAISMKQLTVIY